MTFISLNAASKGLSIVAGLLCLGGVLSYVKADERAKPYALNIAVGAGVLAVGNQLTSKWYQDLANNQLKEITAKLEKDRDIFKLNYHKETTVLAEVKALSAKQSEQLVNLAEELQAKDTALKVLQDKLGRIKAEVEATGKELDRKLQQDDTRFEDLLHEFKRQLVENLSDRIYKSYNQLSDSVEAKLQRENYQAIHENLQKFSESLELNYNFHCSLLNEITNLDGSVSEILTNAVDIYHQVSDEIASLKVRFRNLLNVDERRALDNAYETLADYSKKFTPIDKAKGVLNEYRDFQKEQLEKLYGSISENQNSLEEMREQVGDLLNQLDAEHLKIAQLNQEIEKLKEPIEWRSNILDAQKVGNLIIRYLWRQGVRLDRAFIDNDPYEPILYFNANRLDDVVKVEELNKYGEAIQQHIDLLLEPPHFSFNGQYGLLQTKIKLATKPKPTKDDLAAKIPDCKSLVSKSKRGFLITGHPGSGKTSVMKAIAQWLGNEHSMKLALNPHADDMSSFEDSGFVEINDLGDIYDAIAQLDIELKLRGEDKTRRQTLIVAVDELGRILKDEPKDLDVMEVLRQAAVEGRKFNVIVLIGNHSQTTTAIDMDSQFRDSFYQLFLVGAAVSRINMPNAPALKQYEEEWIRTSAYPVLIGINGRFQSCQHPTHSTYKEYQDSGNPPIGLVGMKPNAVTIGKKTYSSAVETSILNDADKELIAQNKHIVNVKTGAGLSRLIEIVKGLKASKSDEYKRVKDAILEHLKSLD